MNVKASELPPEVRERLETEGKIPGRKKREPDQPKPVKDLAHERLARSILQGWRNWCHWSGVINALIILGSILALLARFLRFKA